MWGHSLNWGLGANLFFALECNLKKFGLPYYLVYLAQRSLSFILYVCMCVGVCLCMGVCVSMFTSLLIKPFALSLCWQFRF